MEICAGPDEIASRGLKLELPKLSKSPGELKVAVWRDDDIAPVDSSVAARVDAVAGALAETGAEVDFDARPVDSEHSHTVYQCLLQATMSARLPEERYEAVRQRVEAMDPKDTSRGAAVQRSQVARFREWTANNEQRTHLRWQWHDFFERFDVLVSPIMSTSAIIHDHRPFADRTFTVNGKQEPYFNQVFWAGTGERARTCRPR